MTTNDTAMITSGHDDHERHRDDHERSR